MEVAVVEKLVFAANVLAFACLWSRVWAVSSKRRSSETIRDREREREREERRRGRGDKREDVPCITSLSHSPVYLSPLGSVI